MADILYLTPKELAERWRISRDALTLWRMRGSGPRFMKIGNKVLYPLPEIQHFEEKHMQASTTSAPAGA